VYRKQTEQHQHYNEVTKVNRLRSQLRASTVAFYRQSGTAIQQGSTVATQHVADMQHSLCGSLWAAAHCTHTHAAHPSVHAPDEQRHTLLLRGWQFLL
jgi:hypothetical protein